MVARKPTKPTAAPAAARDADPISLIGWVGSQVEYLECQAPERLIRAGNQFIGKSTVGLFDLLLHATGLHPFRQQFCRKAGEYTVLCVAWGQSIQIQGKLFNLLPRAWMRPTSRFTKRRGFTGPPPTVEVLHFPTGEWSVIRFQTGEQDREKLAGSTLLGVLCDEPPGIDSYNELHKRVLANSGWISIAMTPMDRQGGARALWVKKAVTDGQLVDIHPRMFEHEAVPKLRFLLGPKSVRPVPIIGAKPYIGEDGKRRNAAWIAEVIRTTVTSEVEITCHGEFLTAQDFAYYDSFDGRNDAPTKEQFESGKLVLGIDHGDKPGKQIAVLMLVLDHGPVELPDVWILDEYVDRSGNSDTMDDAKGIVDMLARWGWKWEDLSDACGDRAHLAGTAAQKSNTQLAAGINRITGKRGHLRPMLRTAKQGEDRGRGSVQVRARYLWQIAAKSRLSIADRCTRVREAIRNWHGPGFDDDWKDPIDAVNYGLDRWCFAKRFAGVGVSVNRR